MPFNRIIWGHGWPEAPQGEVDFPTERMPDNATSADLATLPTLFMAEGRDDDSFAHVGYVQVVAGGRVTTRLRYQYDTTVPPISQDRLLGVATQIGLSAYGTGASRFDWTHTRWTVQEGDIYRTLFHLGQTPGNTPQVFNITIPPRIEPRQLSVMMPFGAGFNATYVTVQAAAAATGLTCQRADDIWVHHNIIQDVVSLIDRSRIVVCDVTGRNANVFYETGIAHTLGREVILIAQHQTDVPFDIAHIRYLEYLPNAQGQADLQAGLIARINTILARV